MDLFGSQEKGWVALYKGGKVNETNLGSKDIELKEIGV